MTKAILDGVTATTTSAGFDVSNFKNFSLQFSAADISSGNGAFTVEVSNNGVIWTAFSMLISNVTNSISEGLTRVATVSVTANASAGSKILCFDPHFGFKQIRVIVTRTTDGTYTAVLFGNKIDS